MRFPTMRIVFGIAVFLAALACSERDRDSVLLISVDTLRADRLDDEGPMPHLRALAVRGTTFTRAHSPTPLTLPSHSTLLSGLDLRQQF